MRNEVGVAMERPDVSPLYRLDSLTKSEALHFSAAADTFGPTKSSDLASDILSCDDLTELAAGNLCQDGCF